MATESGESANHAPAKQNWTTLIDQMVAGNWRNPETGELATVPYKSIIFEETLDGREAELVESMDFGASFTIVCDEATHEAIGGRIAKAITKLGSVRTIVLNHPHADLASAEHLRSQLSGAEGVIAVGSGTINDLCKYATFQDNRPYCVFGTAGSMNGYTSTTASMTLASGLKVSLPAHAPRGFFVDLSVSAQAPSYLNAAGFGDCLARSVAQVDWWMSHRLLGTRYMQTPFLIQEKDETILNGMSNLLPSGDITSIAYLYRVLTLCGLGVSFTGVSNHGSMGEHQISHYIDCFAGDRHPGTLHGQQVGVASLSMARLQQAMIARDTPPILHPTLINTADMVRRMGPQIAAQCEVEWRDKALDEAGADALNTRLTSLWPVLRQELSAFIIPVGEMESLLKSAGGPTTAKELNAPTDLYREAILHAREIRNRFSFLDLAADAGELENFVSGEF